MRSEIPFGVLAIGLILLFIFSDRMVPVTKTHLLEVKCADTNVLTEARHCDAKGGFPGAETVVTVNSHTQKVLIEADQSFGRQSLILENCSVVDSKNWQCKSVDKPLGYAVNTTYAMLQGVFYTIVNYGAPEELHSSSISGWQYWLFKTGAVRFAEAVKLSS